jgi:hypothetical protein
MPSATNAVLFWPKWCWVVGLTGTQFDVTLTPEVWLATMLSDDSPTSKLAQLDLEYITCIPDNFIGLLKTHSPELFENSAPYDGYILDFDALVTIGKSAFVGLERALDQNIATKYTLRVCKRAFRRRYTFVVFLCNLDSGQLKVCALPIYLQSAGNHMPQSSEKSPLARPLSC